VNDGSSQYPGAPPGWYPDPAGGPGRRWWDGYAWTEAVVLPAQPPPPAGTAPASAPQGYGTPWPAAPVREASSLLSDELRITAAARAGVVVIAIYELWDIINLRVNANYYRSIGHQLQAQYRAREHHRHVPSLTIANNSNGALVVFGALLGLATVAAVVYACVWQYRAAATARALGYPAKRSPGWGVGSWFVPVVNLWMPYQAIRDCLPTDDPHRALVRWFWFSYVGVAIVSPAAFVAALFSTGVALALCLPAALLCLGMLATAPRFVADIASAHRSAVGAG